MKIPCHPRLLVQARKWLLVCDTTSFGVFRGIRRITLRTSAAKESRSKKEYGRVGQRAVWLLALKVVVQCLQRDAEDFGGFCLVAASELQRMQKKLALDLVQRHSDVHVQAGGRAFTGGRRLKRGRWLS